MSVCFIARSSLAQLLNGHSPKSRVVSIPASFFVVCSFVVCGMLDLCNCNYK